ncbi:MAG TPA: hypothetical protein VLE53_11810 [Gemmatimonadaceae bacterium]|nr:hypothetical protein [Gemmatimonadaceae bacterium]
MRRLASGVALAAAAVAGTATAQAPDATRAVKVRLHQRRFRQLAGTSGDCASESMLVSNASSVMDPQGRTEAQWMPSDSGRRCCVAHVR